MDIVITNSKYDVPLYCNYVQDQETPLHDTCRNGHLEICRLLIASHADVNAKNKVGRYCYYE